MELYMKLSLTLLILIMLIIILVIYFFYTYYMRNKNYNVVVFDMDETLGHFVQLAVFCDIIEQNNQKKLTQLEFNKIFDLFPEFLRPNIIKILSYLKIKKENGKCQKILIYTNNQGPKSWANKIKKYLEYKINYNLFDQVIGAYKINGKHVEPRRTTHEKTHIDLLNCANLPDNANICFIDDLYHEEMDTKKIYYIQVDQYERILPEELMFERYKKISTNFNFYTLVNEMKLYNFQQKNLKNSTSRVDLFEEIQNFFKVTREKKSRKQKKYNNKSKKVI